MSQNTERINVFFSSESLNELKTIAKENGQTVSGLVRMIVKKWLKTKAEKDKEIKKLENMLMDLRDYPSRQEPIYNAIHLLKDEIDLG